MIRGNRGFRKIVRACCIGLAVLAAAGSDRAALAGMAMIMSPEETNPENCRTAGYELGLAHGKREAWDVAQSSGTSNLLGSLEDYLRIGPARLAALQIVQNDCRLASNDTFFGGGYDRGRRQGWVDVLGYDWEGNYPGQHNSSVSSSDGDLVPDGRLPNAGTLNTPPGVLTQQGF